MESYRKNAIRTIYVLNILFNIRLQLADPLNIFIRHRVESEKRICLSKGRNEWLDDYLCGFDILKYYT